MSTFDPIVYNAVKQINAAAGGGGAREIGELMVVPTGFTHADYLDTGATINSATYPQLAACFAGAFHLGDFAETAALPVRYTKLTPTFLQNLITKDATGDVYAVDIAGNRIIKSTDAGHTWVNHSVPMNWPVGLVLTATSGLYFTGGFFYLGIGNPQSTMVYRSSDAVTWEMVSSLVGPGSSHTYRVANGIHFLTQQSSATVYTSTDAITWTARTMPASGTWSNPQYNGTAYVLVNTAGSVVASSPDLITWTSRTTAASLNNLRVVNSTFVLLSSVASATYYTSADGATWTSRTLPASFTLSNSFSTSDTLYIIPTTGTAAYSTVDGITWTARTLPVASGFVVGFSDLTTVWYVGSGTNHLSDDSLATTTPYVTPTPARSCNWSLLTASSTTVVAYENGTIPATDNYIYRSQDDGATWSAVLLPVTYKITALHYVTTTNTFFALSSTTANGFLVSTDDGATWTSKSWPAFVIGSTQMQHINKSDKSRLLVNAYQSYNQLLTTTNGDDIVVAYSGNTVISLPQSNAGVFHNRVYWYQSTTLFIFPLVRDLNAPLSLQSNASSTLPTALTTGFTWGPMAASDEIMVVLPTVTTSPTATFGYTTDGQNWTAGTMPFASGWADVVWNGTCFVAVTAPINANASYAYSEMRLAYSFDGINWDVFDYTNRLNDSDDIGGIHQMYVFTGGDGSVYVTGTNHNRVIRFDVTDSVVRVPYIPRPSPATKYVVKAK